MRIKLIFLSLAAVLATAALQAGNHNTYPLPEERGTAGILASLQKLPVYVRVLYTTAHPDDESAGTLTWLARKAHARTALYSLTRGDGGQNILGDEKYEAMGLVRTGELLEACRIYGVEPYFSTAFEFGFSKTANETLSKWGHDATLEEMVRFIRRWRPAVIISNFRNDGSGGHGHHQVAGIVTFEAFRAAGDPRRFPEEGLPPWQTRKLYARSMGRGGAGGGSVAIPVGDYDPVLGRSYREIGAEGYSKHRSQGDGLSLALPGQASDNFTLADSVSGKKERETGFFDSVDTSLLAILDLAGDQREAVKSVEPDLNAAQKAAEDALRAFRPTHPAESAFEAVKGIESLSEAIRKVVRSSLPEKTRNLLVDALEEKQRDFQDAVNATLGVYLVARADEPAAIPGQKLSVTATFFNRGPEALDSAKLDVRTPENGWESGAPDPSFQSFAARSTSSTRINIVLPENARVTEPFWYRENPDDNRYKTRPTSDVFAPFDPPRISIAVSYVFRGTRIYVSAPVMAQAGDPIRGSDFVDLQVVPALSVGLKPELAVVPLGSGPQAREFHVSILNNQKDGARGTLRLVSPAGWKVDPAELPFTISRKGESFTARFSLQIPSSAAGNFPVEAVASMSGKEYRRGYRVISYPENWTRNLYSPSKSEVRVVDVRIAPRLTIGYVPGAGDEVPEAIEQLGAKVQMLSGDDLAFADLSGYSAIVTGIRAYNVNESLRANNRRLLDYVEKGGTLIVQYVRPLGRAGAGGTAFFYGPYPMSNSDEDRITVEESPVEMLDPGSPVFNAPNKIAKADFDGWVQERGLYFMRQWDERYTALLSGHDPGEDAKKGGMLVTRYGRGWYIYTAYAWFRQLPAGVPGAFRIFANMLSLGK
jgi:LmbE family N-acetylglucosaminyl deacetylase